MKNKNILIIGLGLIGGSYALDLTNKGYNIYAIDIDAATIKYAIENKIIIDGKTTVEKDFINKFDYIIFGLYPKKIKEFVIKYHDYFKKGAIISDVAGIKEFIIYDIQKTLINNEYISAHPMAGREIAGIYNAKNNLFINANLIITPTDKNTDDGINFVYEIGKALNFKNISILNPKEHDKMIAFLSQLTHCIAMSLMTCKDTNHLVSYTGDSFNDLTRIATINENMWADLFIENKKNLIEEMDIFINEFIKLKEVIQNEDIDKLKELMRLSTKRRASFIKK